MCANFIAELSKSEIFKASLKHIEITIPYSLKLVSRNCQINQTVIYNLWFYTEVLSCILKHGKNRLGP